MTGSSTVKSTAGATMTSTETSDWHHWCRLCAKEHTDNVNVYFRDGDQTWTSELAVAIGKYFWVNVSKFYYAYFIFANTLELNRSKWKMS